MRRATELIKDDHRAVQTMFLEFNAAKSDQDRQRIARKAMAELKVHSAIEEEILYPALRKMDDAIVIDEALEDHEAISASIDDLESRTGSGDIVGRFHDLAKKVQTHIVEEESSMLPNLAADRGQDETLGATIAQRKRELTAQKPDTARQERELSQRRPSPARIPAQRPGEHHVRRF